MKLYDFHMRDSDLFLTSLLLRMSEDETMMYVQQLINSKIDKHDILNKTDASCHSFSHTLKIKKFKIKMRVYHDPSRERLSISVNLNSFNNRVMLGDEARAYIDKEFEKTMFNDGSNHV